MAHVKLNADDLILSYHAVNNDVYTLVCRADLNKPTTWYLVPSMDFVRFDMSGNERHLYITAIHQLQQLQSIKYPKVNMIKEMLQSEIDKFHNTLNTIYNTKTK
ncbi:MAG: hypothetical protein R8M37_01810 [Alphaproteobacteria bacterium]|nr:hypothetical protein [Alphaproteobacteria bacterium]